MATLDSIDNPILREKVREFVKGVQSYYASTAGFLVGGIAMDAITTSIIFYNPFFSTMALVGGNVMFKLYELRSNAASLVDLAVLAKDIVYMACNAWYNRYWSLIGSYYSSDEILSIIGFRVVSGESSGARMAAFYKQYGLPKEVLTALDSFAAGRMTREQLISFMYLENKEQLLDALGAGLSYAIELQNALAAEGASITRSEANLLVKDIGTVMSAMPSEMQELYEEISDALASNDLDISSIDQLIAMSLYGDQSIESYNRIEATTDSLIYGTASSDIVYGKNVGYAGIFTGEGDDIIIAGEGNDYMEGGSGSDTYIWRVGDGDDTILDLSENGDNNRIFYGDEISQGDITFSRSGNDAIFTHTDSGETVKGPSNFVVDGTYLGMLHLDSSPGDGVNKCRHADI